MDVRLVTWAPEMLSNWQKGAGHKTRPPERAGCGLSSCPEPKGTRPPWAMWAGCAQGARQLLGASTGGTAATNGPKSHLKGTLCPASDTWPGWGTAEEQQQQRRQRQQQQTDCLTLALVRRDRMTPYCAKQASRQSHTKLSTAAVTTSPKLSSHVNDLGGGFWSHGRSFSAPSADRTALRPHHPCLH